MVVNRLFPNLACVLGRIVRLIGLKPYGNISLHMSCSLVVEPGTTVFIL